MAPRVGSSLTAAANCARTSGSLVSTSSVVARLRIDESHEPDVGQHALARILDRYGDDVVPLREQLERTLDVGAPGNPRRGR